MIKIEMLNLLSSQTPPSVIGAVSLYPGGHVQVPLIASKTRPLELSQIHFPPTMIKPRSVRQSTQFPSSSNV